MKLWRNLVGYTMGLALMASGALALATGPASAQNLQPIGAEAECPQSLSSFGGKIGLIVGCWCPPDRAAGSVWGSGPYTYDSNICTAAKHAGLLGSDGGEIWAQMAPGEDAYHGSSRNGIQTSAYGKYGGSYNLFSRSFSKSSVQECPLTAKEVTGELTCICKSDRFTPASVWGSDLYTGDSGICQAALHAGAVSRKGGEVTLRMMGGQQSYSGSDRNGISTSDYGPWGSSFLFVRK